MIGYFYSPQWFLAEVPLVQVESAEVHDGLRRRRRPRSPATTRPTTCDKIVSTTFAEPDCTGVPARQELPAGANDDQNLVAKYITADGMEPERRSREVDRRQSKT